MKKILCLSLLFCSLVAATFAQSTTPRFGIPPGGDNTGGSVTYTTATVTLASTDSIRPNSFNSFYKFATLTGAKALKIKTTSAKRWDRVTLYFTADTLTAGRVVTFTPTSGGIVREWTTTSGNTVTVKASKSVVMTFIFDGVTWAEETRSIQY